MISLTVISIVVVALPPVLLAVTVKDVEEVMEVGVPLMAPVVLENERPAGSDGEIDQEVTVPPLEVGVSADMVTSFVRETELGVYVMDDGATSLTTMDTTVALLPPEFEAVTV